MAQEQDISVQIYGSSADPTPGTLHLERWTPHEAKARARKKVLKIVGSVLAISPACLFVHVLVIPIALSLFSLAIGSFPLYMYWSEEQVTCLSAEGRCLSCNQPRNFSPYPSGRYKDPMTVQCKECGQTFKAYA